MELPNPTTNNGVHSTAATVTRRETPARHVLNNQELTSLVFSFLDVLTTKDDNKKALVGLLATVNKAFFHASTDVVWRSMPSLSPLLRLLPKSHSDDKVQAEMSMNAIKADPWSRFRVYCPKVKNLALIDDAAVFREMPNHWFLVLFTLPSRPSLLFPKLTRLVIKSLAGVNSVIPFHVTSGLETVFISDFSDKPWTRNGLETGTLKSLLASLACNAPRLWSLVSRSPLSATLTPCFHHFSRLTNLSLVIPSPVSLDNLVCLNKLRQLKSLTLFSLHSGTEPQRYPGPGSHLDPGHPDEGKSTVTSLTLEGDAFFTFWATKFFSSRSLKKFTATIWKDIGSPVQGILLVPHTLHVLAHICTGLEEVSMEWHLPSGRLDGTECLERYEHQPDYQIPDQLFRSVATMRNLKLLQIKHIPFVVPNFTVLLLESFPELKLLRKIAILPVPLSNDARHRLVLPPLHCLRTMSVNLPLLQNVTIALDTSIPLDKPDLHLPGHGLKSLFVVIPRRRFTTSVSTLVRLATYLDRVFPNLEDVTSYFEEDKVEKCLEAALGPLSPGTTNLRNFWKDVNDIMSSFRALRSQVALSVEQSILM